MPTLSPMRCCKNCHALFYNGDKSFKGLCPSNGERHQSDERFAYVLTYDTPETGTEQANWRRCSKCQVIFYDGYEDEQQKGKCDAGDYHAGAPSHNFTLPHDVAGDAHHETGWEFCVKCNAVVNSGLSGGGNCGAGGPHEFNSGAFHFVLPHGTKAAPKPVKFD